MAVTGTISPNQQHDDSSASSRGDSRRFGIDEAAFRTQIERILQSEELRGSEALRQLLKFLAERSVSGSTDDLKEYSIAIEALGKPTSYDPRHNSAVRILAGRLRQKLTTYYLVEGQHDPVLVDLPKGHFKLTFALRESPLGATDHSYSSPVSMGESENLTAKPAHFALRVAIAAGWVLLGIAAGIAGETALHRSQARVQTPAPIVASAAWDPSLEELWKPFVVTNRPTIMALGSPLFVVLDVERGIFYRDKSLNDWNDVVSSPNLKAIRAVVKSDHMEPVHYYTAFGAAEASFMISRLLGSRVQNLSVVRSSDLSMQEVADNNVIFLGNQTQYFSQQIHASPVEPLLLPTAEGIRNLKPEGNEPEIFLDHYSEAPSEEGVAYALVSHLPGPLGGNDVESFSSSRTAGYVAAAKAFTDPEFVNPLVAKLKAAGGGHMPQYYQVLLKVQFKTEVPTEITYVLTRALQYRSRN